MNLHSPVAADLLSLLDEQQDDFVAMYAAGLAQRECLARDDMSGVGAALAKANTLMGRIRLRQARLPNDLATRAAPEVGERTRAIRDAILRVEKLRLANEATVRRLLEETRGEIRQSTRGRKAARGYRAQRVEEARFYDGRR